MAWGGIGFDSELALSSKMLGKDNARSHTARVTKYFMQQKMNRTLSWPAYSPDLDHNEHLWDEVQRRFNRRRPVPTTIIELGTVFRDVWFNITMALINRSVHSMHRRNCRKWWIYQIITLC